MKRIIACLMLLAGAVALVACAFLREAHGAGLPKRGKIAAEQPRYEPPRYASPEVAELGWKAHNWYMGLVGGYAWTPSEVDDTWHGGLVGGYLWRSGATGFAAGVEADYVVRDLGSFTLDDGVGSLRGRAGLYVNPKTFVYGTVGVAQATPAFVPDGFRKGLVLGGGVELEATKTIAVRAEVLHYRHGDGYFEWAGHGSTAGRVGLVFKF